MRWLVSLCVAMALTACGAQPNAFPPEARAGFSEMCRYEARKCDCAWDKITRAMTHEEYQAALADFETRGVMDRRIVMASVECAH